MKLSLFFRKKQPEFNSIEEIFNALHIQLKTKITCQRFEVPCKGASISAFLKNSFYAYKNRSQLNHITGHVNYIALATGKNTILTIHDVKSNIYGNSLKRLFLIKFWFWFPALFVKKITVISEFSKKELCQLIPFAKSKITVIHNPIKEEIKYSPKLFNEEKPLILHLGTKSNKNLERTIDAIKNINCQLMIIGKLSDGQRQYLRYKHIDYINKYHISFEEIIDAYKSSDLVCFTSTYEGFGMPIIEAQAIGRAVITSNICSMPEVAGNGAHIVNPFNTDEIRKGIIQIIENKEYRELLIKNGLENVKRFNIDTITKQYLKIYKEVNKSL